MESWLIYTLSATLMAGTAVVFSKMGMGQANEHVALVIRTGILFLIVLGHALLGHGLKNIQSIPYKPLVWFVLAGITTAVYWIMYFKAIAIAPVSRVAMIDRMSIVVTVMLSALLLKEPITARFLLGGVFILIGVLILTWR